ncbi:hypothetical protein SK128_027328 [Halocaridina rubra]|uniref:Uncharacterized protein n=1 Tax=Halocaridina rubra TaxID=373956 RepID=A0AAN8XMI5_HALRR
MTSEHVMTSGGYRVGASLLVTSLGFIVSYAIIFDQLSRNQDTKLFSFTQADMLEICMNITEG